MRLMTAIAASLFAGSAWAAPDAAVVEHLKFLALGNGAAGDRPASIDSLSYHDALDTLDSLSPGDLATLGLLVELGEISISPNVDEAIRYRTGGRQGIDR